MNPSQRSSQLDDEGLRERHVPQQACSAEEAEEIVQGLNNEEHLARKDEKDKKTFGRTPDGTGTYCVHILALPRLGICVGLCLCLRA